jgi:perosamine synthetase
MIVHSKPTITEIDRSLVDRLLCTGKVADGEAVQQFEQNFALYTGVKQARFMVSGSAAIFSALKLLGIGPGDEVILPTYLCHSVLDAIIASGAQPVLCDVSDRWNANYGDVERVFTKRVRCIILVHTMGVAVDIDKFKAFNVPIIEDCCQALGAKNSNGGGVGTIGDFSVFSFHATKCITTGKGGMLCVNNQDYFKSTGGHQQFLKRNECSVTDIQAVLGISQLRQYEKFLEKRADIADRYFEGIKDTSLTYGFAAVLPISNRFRFLLTVNSDFDEIVRYFSKKRVAVRKGVDELLHISYPHLSRRRLPNAERIFRQTVSIPIYPSLAPYEQEIIIGMINDYWSPSS